MKLFWKIILIILVSLSVFSSLYCDDEEPKQILNAAALDLSPTINGLLNNGYGIGISYEYGFLERFSALITVGYMEIGGPYLTNNISNYYTISYGIVLRYYAYGEAIEGGFIGVGARYGQANYLLNTGDSLGGTILYIPGEIGYKYIFTEAYNLFVEVSVGMSFYYALSGYNEGYMNFTAGDFGLRFGVAF